MSVEAVAPADALVFSSRDPGVLHGALWMGARTFDTAEGAARGLAALADLDAFRASLAALLVTAMNDNIAEQPLEGRDGQPTRLGGDLAHAATVSELALVYGTSEAVAARTLNFSTALVATHPGVHEALASGDITEAHARVVVEQAATLPEEAAQAFGIEALTKLRSRRGLLRTPSEFRTIVRNLRERRHPESIVTRRARARADRGVWFRPEDDGMCSLTALLPAETGLAMYERIDALARAAQPPEDELRTLPQLRADALAQLALTATGRAAEGSEAEPTPEALAEPIAGMEELIGRIRAEIVVHIPVAVLLGASDDVAELEGYGVIDATTARQLAAAAPTWERLLTDVEGVPLSLGRTAYRPSAGLRRFIEYRDGTCIVPNCTCAAHRSEVDHTIEWQDGGTTDAKNLALLCRKHHALKSLALFHLRREAAADPERGDNAKVSGELVWETLLGRRYPAEAMNRSHILGPEPPKAAPPPLAPAPASGDPAPSSVIRNDPPPF
ncbi:HNH endonuclease signature motif containing protein [Sinomonas mesophila]|uniref:HNH endonuclease signature motif containing protein n=1 Tax=Sinomonas mesophila TaxID=1531955 RepID=UPI000984FB82|nr:HNH endonuclease signature motif containing protein [Sinomonas mesophila]